VSSLPTRLAAVQPSSCAACSLRKLCIPAGLSTGETVRLSGIIGRQLRLRRQEALVHAGDRFVAVFVVKAGTFETSMPLAEGGRQVTGFPMASDFIGLTGIAQGVLAFDAVALEDSQVCEIAFGQLEALARALPTLQHRLHRQLSQEIVDCRTLASLIAHSRADERIARFLLQLAERRRRLGLSADELILQMTREDIGNLLGLRIETISRGLSRLENEGILDVRSRLIRIRDREALRRQARRNGDVRAGAEALD